VNVWSVTLQIRLDGEPDQAEELETRVNRVAEPIPADAQPLNFVPNPGLKRRDH